MPREITLEDIEIRLRQRADERARARSRLTTREDTDHTWTYQRTPLKAAPRKPNQPRAPQPTSPAAAPHGPLSTQLTIQVPPELIQELGLNEASVSELLRSNQLRERLTMALLQLLSETPAEPA